MFWARAEIFLLSSIISSWTPIPHESGFMRIKCEGWWSFQVLLCFLLTQTSLSHLILSSFLMIGQSFMILLSYWSMISSQESDIISLEAVVEGHPFPVTFKYTLHKCWNNLTPAGGEFKILFAVKCMQIPVNEDSVTDILRWWSSFIWMQIQRESWVWCITSTSSPQTYKQLRYCVSSNWFP